MSRLFLALCFLQLLICVCIGRVITDIIDCLLPRVAALKGECFYTTKQMRVLYLKFKIMR